MIPWYPRRVSLLIREGLSEWKKSNKNFMCEKNLPSCEYAFLNYATELFIPFVKTF